MTIWCRTMLVQENLTRYRPLSRSPNTQRSRLDGLNMPKYRAMTQRLGNRGMTVALGKAEEELRSDGTISAGTRKTIKLGARTQTMKVGSPDEVPQNVPSQEEIRRLTGA